MRPYRILTIVLVLFLCFNVAKAAYGDVTLDTVPDYNGWGWDALVVDNEIIQLVIIPDIGGRVMFYGFTGDEYMAVNDGQMGHVYDPDVTNNGPWSSWGYGGYKCWPAPQSRWNWPPPPHLDWGIYSFITEHASSDSVVIYLQSEVETKLAAGLQQARRFRMYKNSTRVSTEQILKNVSNVNNTWSIWEVTQALPDHNNTSDYSNISVYFPANSSDVKILSGSGVNTSSVNDSIRKYNHNKSNNKIGVLNTKGWSCFVDERDEQSYAKVFDVDASQTHPDQNTNFQIYSGGDYDEIEVLSPIYTIEQGDSASYTEYWYASHTKGAMQNINHAGAVLSRLFIDSEFVIIGGVFGIYNSGKLKLVFSDDNSELGSIDTFNVSASQKFDLILETDIPVGTTRLDLIAYDDNNILIDTLDTWIAGNNIDGINVLIAADFIDIYPTIVESGSSVNIQLSSSNSASYTLALMAINGQVIEKVTVNPLENSNLINYNIPVISSGIYILTVQSGNFIANSKIIIK